LAKDQGLLNRRIEFATMVDLLAVSFQRGPTTLRRERHRIPSSCWQAPHRERHRPVNRANFDDQSNERAALVGNRPIYLARDSGLPVTRRHVRLRPVRQEVVETGQPAGVA
jgi:hypothetical protein